MTISKRFSPKEFRRQCGRAGEGLSVELETIVNERVLRAPDPPAEVSSVLEELEAVGHRLLFSPDDSDTGWGVWIAGDFAVWVHGQVGPKGDVRSVNRIEILWQRM